jgi:hypothetical protein
VIIKPASETPLTMLALMPLLEEAGVPKGLVNVLPSKKRARWSITCCTIRACGWSASPAPPGWAASCSIPQPTRC